MATLALSVKNLTKDYGTYRAVDNISFDVPKGSVLGLLGPNGAGKTTTIQMLVGVTSPSSGSVSYFGMDFGNSRQACLARVNFASAYNTLQGRITVWENMMIFAGLYGVRDRKAKITELLQYFEIERLAKSTYWDLSAGERTRVNLAKSLLNDPELVLMDEPTASLDPDIADKTLTLIEDLRASKGLSILFTSHNMAEVERICDEVIFLDRGRVVSQDTPQNHTKARDGVELAISYAGAKADVERTLIEIGAVFTFEGRGRVMIRTDQTEIAPILATVTNAGIRVTDVDVNRRTLEDVFLDIARGRS